LLAAKVFLTPTRVVLKLSVPRVSIPELTIFDPIDSIEVD